MDPGISNTLMRWTHIADAEDTTSHHEPARTIVLYSWYSSLADMLSDRIRNWKCCCCKKKTRKKNANHHLQIKKKKKKKKTLLSAASMNWLKPEL